MLYNVYIPGQKLFKNNKSIYSWGWHDKRMKLNVTWISRCAMYYLYSLLHASSHLCCSQSCRSFSFRYWWQPRRVVLKLVRMSCFCNAWSCWLNWVRLQEPVLYMDMCRQQDARTICLRTMCPQTKSLGSSIPWPIRPLDDAALGHVVPDQYVLILDCINVLVKISYFGLFNVYLSR